MDLLIFLVALSILIIVHEVGHFIAARFFGIWVEEFGIGIPPRLFGKKKGNTIYSINLIPAGGFVKLHGEEEAGMDESKIKKPELAFFSKPWWQKSIILVSGVLMNFLLSLIIVTFIFTQGVPDPNQPTNVSVVEVASGSPASEAGIKTGDIIISVDGVETKTIEEVAAEISKNAGEPTQLTILRPTQGTNESISVIATPRVNPPEGEGALGIIQDQNYLMVKYPVTTAWYHGLSAMFELSWLTAKAIVGVFWDFITQFKVSQDVAGPIGMFQYYSNAIKQGVLEVLWLTAMISLSLAIINLFPIPPLDGSRLMFVLVEKFTGKKLKKSWEQNLYKFSFLFLILLFLLISFQDIKRLIGN
ncbi:site-2 protease family protein [Candidatus Gottesmanbacteria bacterium]|nr:site-2 protease family protein [Candidatus Gottesmanbacteria bacterium]